MTTLPTAPWREQQQTWPQDGRHLLACHDDTSIVVYQAYRRAIADFAITHQHFGGEFSLSRMSWIKPGFLWMMYRSGWATKPDQERVLAIRLPLTAFDAIVAAAVPSTFDSEQFANDATWRAAVRDSDVRVQWDPDHDPHGRPLERRAVQLGLRGATLRRYALDWPLEIIDMTDFIAQQCAHLDRGELEQLETPIERVHTPTASGRERDAGATVLYRPVGQKELDLIAEADWRGFPPRLDWQPIFYPVLNEEYATQIARDWNTKDTDNGSVGYVTRFAVRNDFLADYEVHQVGGSVHVEYWIPAEDLDSFNDNIVGRIEVASEWRGDPPRRVN